MVDEAPDKNGSKHEAQTSQVSSSTGADKLWLNMSESTQSLLRATLVVLSYYILVIVMFIPFAKNWEGDVNNRVIDAMYFASVTLSTVGYGDILPIDGFTQIVTGMLILITSIFIMHEVTVVIDIYKEKCLREDKEFHDKSKNSMLSAKQRNFINGCNISERRQLLVTCIAKLMLMTSVTTGVFYFAEGYDFVDSVYGAVATLTTVGYGDVSFTRPGSRVFATFWLILSPIQAVYCIQGIVEAVVDSKGQRQAKLIDEKHIQDEVSTMEQEQEINFILSRWKELDMPRSEMLNCVGNLQKRLADKSESGNLSSSNIELKDISQGTV